MLKSVKRKNESFSDAIKRLIGSKGRLAEVLDLCPEVAEEEEFERAVKTVRERLDEEVERVVDEVP